MSTDREFLVSLQAQIATQLGAVVPPNPNPDPPPPAGDNPFIAWKAQGLPLNDVHDYKLHGGLPRHLTEQQWAQALAAGYQRSDLDASSDPGGPSGFPPGFDLTGTERGTGVRNLLQPGQLYPFSWRASFTGGARWNFEVNPTEGGATATTASWDGAAPAEFKESNGIPFQAVAGQMHTITLQLNGRATVATIVRAAG